LCKEWEGVGAVCENGEHKRGYFASVLRVDLALLSPIRYPLSPGRLAASYFRALTLQLVCQRYCVISIIKQK